MSTETVERAALKIDFDAVVPCEWYFGCAAEAEWAGRHVCCPKESKLCSAHRRISQQEWFWALQRGPIECKHCRTTPMPAPVWRPV